MTVTNGDTNGHTNGQNLNNNNNGGGCWVIGLLNSVQKYLTAETFGFKVNANGPALKKKQLWVLEPFGDGTDAVCLKSHLEKYLSIDQFGNVTCDSEEKDNGARLEILVQEGSSGCWALRHPGRGYFLGAVGDKLVCTAKSPGDSELWYVHLASRPQLNLRSTGRRRFAHLSDAGDEIYVDANIPWGASALFSLEFREEARKYVIRAANNRFLSRDGLLLPACDDSCLFSMEFYGGFVALRDNQGLYLGPIGSKALLRTRSTVVTKDELFSLEDSLPQAVFVSVMNGRHVSVKQGIDVSANQEEISDQETFQLEFDAQGQGWYIRTMGDRFWLLESTGGIQASAMKKVPTALFELVWNDDGSVALRANNGKFVATKKSGHLYANVENVDDTSKFYFYLINRPNLTLKCEQGFVGYKSCTSTKLECNKASYETITIERAPKGIVYFKGSSGQYWQFTSEGISADSDDPQGFYLQLQEPCKLRIKSCEGKYVAAEKNGGFAANTSDPAEATLWEI